MILSADAAGNGWFVDPTPFDDEEFRADGVGEALTAREDTGADGRMDLLSVVMHEMGHLAGEHDHFDDGLMGAFLTEGGRRTEGLAGVFLQSL